MTWWVINYLLLNLGNPMKSGMNKKRLVIILLLIVIIPVGFYTKYYSGPAHAWINNSMGGLVYEIFWCLVVAFFFPRSKAFKIALWVFGITCLLEFLQLWHTPLLEYIRSGFIGRTVLGNSFNWLDFPYYAVGSLCGWYLLKMVQKITAINRHTSDQQGQ